MQQVPATGEDAPPSDPIAPKPEPARLAILTPGQLALILFAVETALFQLCVWKGGPWLWLAGHLVIMASAAVYIWRGRGAISDLMPYFLPMAATAAAGPVGALFAAIALRIRSRSKTAAQHLLDDWYERIALAGDVDPVTALYNTVAMGRAVLTSDTPPAIFDEVMQRGSLADRQTALGLIARHFSPSYAPALRHALVSPEPVIRVQAAAVAVKVRAGLKDSLSQELGEAGSVTAGSPAAASLAASLDAMAETGLLEDEDRDRSRAVSRRLTSGIADGLIAGSVKPADIPPAARSLIETHLLDRGAFAAFRSLRAAAQSGTPLPSPQMQPVSSNG